LNTSKTAPTPRAPSALEKRLIGVPIEQLHTLLPGLLVAALLAWASKRLCVWIGCDLMGFAKTPISAVTAAILLGLLLNNLLPLPKLLRPGLTFAVKKVLRLGIMMLGIRLSFVDALQLGLTGVPIVVGCILGALGITALIGRWLKLPRRLATLIAVGTSICGVSAIVATGPAIEAEDEEVAYAVATITVFGILATFLYPYLAYTLFGQNAAAAGRFIGTSIHDTSQVTGAALILGDVYRLARAVEVATVTKLVRNVFMALVIPLTALYYNRRTADRDSETEGGAGPGIVKLLPFFVLGFLLFALLRSVGDAGVQAGGEAGGRAFGLWDAETWAGIHGWIKTWAANLLVVALAGVGLNTSTRILRGLGLKPFLAGLAAALGVGVISYALITLMGFWIPLS
jgi:uncharacterized integral membrane protein (TIGR00698 family)